MKLISYELFLKMGEIKSPEFHFWQLQKRNVKMYLKA
jgi:hypothetical protein